MSHSAKPMPAWRRRVAVRIARVPAVATLAALSMLGSLASPARAQSDSVTRRPTELTLLVGVSQRRQHDVTASPLVFGGSGFDGAATYARALSRTFAFDAGIAGGTHRLGTAASAARENVIEAGAHVSVLRTVIGVDNAARSLSVGLALAGGVISNQHAYATPTETTANFLMASATLGPDVVWRERMRSGVASVEVRTPIAGLVDHPYSEAKVDYTPVAIRTVSFNTLRALDGSITFAPASTRRAGLLVAYRFSLLRFADVQPFEAATQSLSIGFATRFGARGPR
ncbi:MAG TPA: hypothetical protein VN706_09680 [Gemmatimonadaceae bacterium]|nr:hypothetical protein [Gemmatimonadaceae bacterium]